MALMDATTALSFAAVPTVCLGLLDHMEQQQLRLSSLRLLVVGGAACPRQECVKINFAVSSMCMHGVLLEQQQLRLSSLRLLVVGGAACPRQVCGG